MKQTLEETIKDYTRRADDLRQKLKDYEGTSDPTMVMGTWQGHLDELEQIVEWLKELKTLRENKPLFLVHSDGTIEEVGKNRPRKSKFKVRMNGKNKLEPIDGGWVEVLQMKKLGFSSHDSQIMYGCPKCENIYGSWWFFHKGLKKGDVFKCGQCRSLLEVPE